jgi:tetratricopeptide (TPR) repeat protein
MGADDLKRVHHIDEQGAFMIRMRARSRINAVQKTIRNHARTALILGAVLSMTTDCIRADDPAGDSARKEYARRYLEPDAHMLLAKYLVDTGKKAMAFCLMENARQRFGDDLFNLAHLKVFARSKPIVTDEASEKQLLETLKSKPDDVETTALLADVYAVRGDFERAAEFAEKACKLAPESFECVDRLNLINELRQHGAEAERAYGDFVKRNPDSSEAYSQRIFDLLKTDKNEASRLIDEGCQKHPQDGDLLLHRAWLQAEQGRLDDAEKTYLQAVALEPRSSATQGSLGRFYLKQKHDEEKSIECYLNAYFVNPHYYDGEFAEFRLSEMLKTRDKSKYQELRKHAADAGALLQHDDFMVVSQALREIDQNWRPEYLEPMVALLTHDYEGVRWRATQALANHADDGFDPRLRELLKDPNDYRRGCAAYIAANRWKEKSFDDLRRLLKDESQLVQYDAISALMMTEIPEAKTLVREEVKDPKNPFLQEMLKHLE